MDWMKVTGTLQWQPPPWLGVVGRFLERWWKVIFIGLVILTAAVAWYWLRPVPHYVEYTVTQPGLTEYGENGISSIKPLVVDFKEAAAPLQNLDKKLNSGIEISPSVAGSWAWNNDRQLQFTPKNDWPVDGGFTVHFNKRGFFAREVRVEDYSFDFHSPAFTAKVTESQFYQDPRDPNLKKLVATVTFSHPVDPERFEGLVSMSVAKDAEYLGLKPDTRHFTVAYDKFKLAAHIHSAALGMPRDDTPMTVRIDKGVRAARGGNETKERLQAVVTIPGRSSLRFSEARMTLVDNAKYEPEQILMLTSSSPVAETALTGKVAVYLLPVRHPQQPKEQKEPYAWTDEGQVGKEILAASQRVNVTYVPSEEGGNTAHGFKFLAPVGRYLFVSVPAGIEGIGGYIAGKPFTATLQVEPYRQALTFLGQGALLSLSGDRKVGYLARDVDHVEVEIGRVLPDQLQHVAPQMWDFSKPYVDSGLADRVVERFTAVRDYRGKQPGKPTYDSIDLGQYLQGKTSSTRGLFLLRIRSVKGEKRDNDEEGPDAGEGKVIRIPATLFRVALLWTRD